MYIIHIFFYIIYPSVSHSIPAINSSDCSGPERAWQHHQPLCGLHHPANQPGP